MMDTVIPRTAEMHNPIPSPIVTCIDESYIMNLKFDVERLTSICLVVRMAKRPGN